MAFWVPFYYTNHLDTVLLTIICAKCDATVLKLLFFFLFAAVAVVVLMLMLMWILMFAVTVVVIFWWCIWQHWHLCVLPTRDVMHHCSGWPQQLLTSSD